MSGWRMEGEGARGRIAVMLMAYGGPDSLADVEPYLMDVRGGRPMRPEIVEEIRERYRLIGGRSPILELTRRQAEALERRLTDGAGEASAAAGRRQPGGSPEGPEFRVYVGMRHWTPYIREAMREVARDGASLGVAIALAPQYSSMSVGAYLRRLEEARGAEGPDIQWRAVESWCDHPRLIDAFEEKVRGALARLPEDVRGEAVVVFTAHSLPERILAENDPYPREVRRTIEAVVERLPGLRWRQAWQSQGQTGERWLGPEAADVLRGLAAEGRPAAVVAPIGFLCDHVEILYDVDVHYRDLARELGLAFERSDSLNDDPLLIDALADLVRRHMAEPGSREAPPAPRSSPAGP